MAVMLAQILLGMLFHSLSALSSPVTSSVNDTAPLVRRANACDPGGVPILYEHEYGASECPPKYKIDSDGSCPTGNCLGPSYCEMRQNFYFGQEQPLPNGFCHGDSTCSVTSSMTTTYTLSGSITFTGKVSDALNIGVTGGYSVAHAETDTHTDTKILGPDQCGYWTFLPILRESCGTMTNYERVAIPYNVRCLKLDTTGNFCSTQLYRSRDGNQVMGDTVFVWSDCGTHIRLPKDKQDKAYQHDGVQMPQQQFAAFAQAWDCTLSPECQNPVAFEVNTACTCHCGGKQVGLGTAGCAGFKGSLPTHPIGPQPAIGP